MEVQNLVISIFLIQILALPTHTLPRQMWNKLNGRQIFIEDENKYSWFEASDECTRRNMSLLAIDSIQKSSAVTGLLTTFCYQRLCLLWIGGNDLATEGNFVWSSTGKSIEFSNWSKDEPNNAKTNEDCVMLHLKFFEWNDANCSSNYGFICEENPFKVSARRELDAIKNTLYQLFKDCED